ncbi:MAG: xylose isomerase, partial [Candidatus Hydrogenedentota bacterium]
VKELDNQRTLAGIFGSLDVNRGDTLLGWDTDQFPNDVSEATLVMYTILQGGGLTTGGFNFDAKVRRQSIDAADLFHAHVGGMDVMARGLLNAAALIESKALQGPLDERYAGWNGPLGKEILSGKVCLGDLAARVKKDSINPRPKSGRQEFLENVLNRYV